MLITIQNKKLQLTVDTLGAQMMHLVAGGEEYLWQGDDVYWEDRAPVLFPYVGRLTDEKCTVSGDPYSMGIHGFAAACEFAAEKVAEDAMVLVLEANAETLSRYPFAFRFAVTYALKENTVAIAYRVENKGEKVMPFGIGGHPGFGIPHAEGEAIEDYYLEFAYPCLPDKMGVSDTGFMTGHDLPCPLAEGKYLPLDPTLHSDDTVLLRNMAKAVTLRSKKSDYAITVSYPEMPYLGLWPWPGTGAPFLCIEPWASLPARQDVVEELTAKSDLIHLPGGKIFETEWSITVGEKKA